MWAFAGHSRSFWVGMRGAFAGIRGHSRVWCRSSLLTASTHTLRFCLGFSTLRLSGMPPEVMQKKPEILVEQTLYIILLAKIDTAACGDAGVVRSVLLRILPRMFFPFCLPPTFSSNELSSCSVHQDRLVGDDQNQPASHPDLLADDDHNQPATHTAWLMIITTSQPPRPPG